ncbi:hypothetical protein DFJ63DRAFT_93860 [Scheffersomyces coipomensis]|uniref:uncharacterized protein n=1 Tax=Scheffersomyces coipomensis TaxID=1788519 RepID=UPI00315DD54D
MKLSIVAVLFQLLNLVLGYSISSGSVSIGQQSVAFGEVTTQEIKQLTVDSGKDKIVVKLGLSEKLKKAPQQVFVELVSAKNDALATHFVPTFTDDKQFFITIPVGKLPEVLKAQDKLLLNIIIADGSKKLYKKLVEIIPTYDFKSGINYQPQPKIGYQPEIHHIFREDPKTVGEGIPVFFTAMALVLFTGLLVLWNGFIGKDLFGTLKKTAPGQLIFNIAFLLSILGFEYNFAQYYLGQSIFTTLYAGFFLGLSSIYFGARVLRHLAHERRIGRS